MSWINIDEKNKIESTSIIHSVGKQLFFPQTCGSTVVAVSLEGTKDTVIYYTIMANNHM